MKKSIPFVFLLLILSMTTYSQRYFSDIHTLWHDSLYFPQIETFKSNQQWDSVYQYGTEGFNFYSQRGDYEQAYFLLCKGLYTPTGYGLRHLTIPRLQEAIASFPEHLDTIHPLYATLHQMLGFAYKFDERMEAALPHYLQALAIHKLTDAEPVQIWGTMQETGSVLIYMGRFFEGYQYLMKALAGFEKNNMLHEASHCYLELAMAMNNNNQSQLAITFNNKSLEIIRKNFPEAFNHVVVASNLANVYLNTGKYEKVIYYANYADSVMRHYGNEQYLRFVYFSMLANRGIAYRNMKEFEQAAKYFSALYDEIVNVVGPQHPLVGDALAEIAFNHEEAGQIDSAFAYFEKVKNINPQFEGLPFYLARLHLKKNEPSEAIQAMLAAYTSSSDVHKPIYADNFKEPFSGFEQAQLLMKAAHKAALQTGDVRYFQDAIDYSLLADTLMRRFNETTLIGRNDKNIANAYHQFASEALSLLHEASAYMSDKNFDNLIVRFMSHSKAFKLTGEMNQMKLASSFSDDSLRQQQMQLLKEIGRLENMKLALSKNQDTTLLADSIDNQLLKNRITAFENSYRLKHQSERHPEWFRPVSIKDIQKHLNQELIITYHTGKEKVFALGISDKAHQFAIVSESENLNNLIRKLYRTIKTGETITRNNSGELYDILLAPMERLIEEGQTIIIIPDGILHQIPLEILVKDQEPLIVDHPVIYNYSIQLWYQNQQGHIPAYPKSFVAFAPVFSDQPEIASNNPLRYDSSIYRDFNEIRNGNKLAPLFFSLDEAMTVTGMFAEAGKKIKIFVEKNATESNFKNYAFDYDIIHIATHGFASRKNPRLSGLFFYKNDPASALTNDGFLFSEEIFQIPLKADLVVLSACKTGYGKIETGEGVLALPRGFIFNGVPNVMASLWKVHDAKTRNLIVSFYEGVLHGKTYSRALQEAKLKAIREGQLPIDWASMILIGVK